MLRDQSKGGLFGIGLAIAMGALAMRSPMAQAAVRFVDASATGANNGTSWPNAYTSLQSALSAAGSGDEIDIATGTYKPAGANGSRTATFQLKTGVSVLGGFPHGGGTRDPAVNIVTLSGDLNGNDGSNFVNNGENSYHVVTGSGVASSSLLDGVTIAAGNAIGSGHEMGGGIYNQGGSPTLTNCIIRGNYALWVAGGMYNTDSTCRPALTNCMFLGNRCQSGGAVGNDSGSQPTFTNCTFIGNSTVGDSGGGMYNTGGAPTATGCVFAGNLADAGGAAINNTSGVAVLNNCVFVGNSSGYGSGVYNNGGSPKVTNCIFSGNHASRGGAVLNKNSTTPSYTNCLFNGNTADSHGGAMANDSSTRPTVVNCTFAENAAGSNGGGGIHDQDLGNSSPPVTNCILWGNSDTYAGGSVESRQIHVVNPATDAPTVTYCVIQGLNLFAGTGNSDLDPTFVGGPTGSWTASASYSATTGRTTFTAVGAGYTPGALVGSFLNPDVTQWLQSRIVANTATTITVWGDFAPFGSPGVTYRVTDYHLGLASRCIDAGSNSAIPVGVTTDIDGDARTRNCRVDLGADETPYYFDCNTNGLGDACDTASGTSRDCNSNGVPDECESQADCNGNAVQDICDIAAHTSADCNLNHRPDECDVPASPGFPSGHCVTGCSNDCNQNGIPDECDLTGGTGTDCNTNGMLDACEPVGAGTRVYVDIDAVGLHDGTSWANAFTDLQAALCVARSHPAITEIWVAEGTYLPSQQADPLDVRSKTFQLVNGVAIYVGFIGNETNLGQRDWTHHVTTLSGNIGNAGSSADNSYHVVSADSTITDTVHTILDGATITGGNANSTGGANNMTLGGGVYNVAGSPTIVNCRFLGNYAMWSGAGMHSEGGNPVVRNCTFSGMASQSGGAMSTSSSNAVVTNCTFIGNSTIGDSGGGMYIQNGSPVITSCAFIGNHADAGGAGINAISGSTKLTNCVFTGNVSGYGSGLYNSGGSPTLVNCTFSRNHANDRGGAILNISSATPNITNCIFWGNSDSGGTGSTAQIRTDSGTPVVNRTCIQGGWSGAGGTGNITSNPLFANDDGFDNVVGTLDDNLRLTSSSPCINAGSNAAIPGGVTTDFDGYARINNGTVDMGAFEWGDYCPGDPAKDYPGVCGCGVPETGDNDGDGAADCIDGCPNDPAKTAAGACGCGLPETDSDGDGTPNCTDGCPNDAAKIAPGSCGCGTPETDSDTDGTPNCVDGCPNDPAKTAPSVCGCGVSDTDSDGDGTPNCHDGCPNDPNKTAAGICGCGVADTDSDNDGTPNCNDGCPADPSKIVPGACGCGTADTDSDGDGTPDCHDGCPSDPSKTAAGLCGCGVSDYDADGDGTPDCNDACPADPNKTTPGLCGCGTADTDSDGDAVPDCHDVCPGVDDHADCNTNSTPDCAEIAGGSSTDCHGDSIPDECQTVRWAGSVDTLYLRPENWDPAMVPTVNAVLANSSGIDSTCALNAGEFASLCRLTVSASGAGRQILQIGAGAALTADAETTVDFGGSIALLGGQLAGGPVTNLGNTISGWGLISASVINLGQIDASPVKTLELTGAGFDNRPTGRLRALIASGVLVHAPAPVQSGTLEVQVNGSLVFDAALTNSSGGWIKLYDGGLGAAGVTNETGANIYGFGSIQGSIINRGDITGIANLQIVGDLLNNGRVTVQGGVLTITGALSGNGTIIGGFGGRDGDAATILIRRDFDLAADDFRAIDLTTATLQLSGDPANGPQHLEALAQDIGRRGVTLPDVQLFSIGTLRIGPAATTVRLVDNHHRLSGGDKEAFYVERLVLDPGVTLDLGGLRLYYRHVTPADPLTADSDVRVIDTVGGGSLSKLSRSAKRLGEPLMRR